MLNSHNYYNIMNGENLFNTGKKVLRSEWSLVNQLQHNTKN